MGDVRMLSARLLNAAYRGELGQLQESANDLSKVLKRSPRVVLDSTMDEGGRRALHLAAAGGRRTILMVLIQDMKLDINIQDESGETPLCVAAKEGHPSSVSYLMLKGADPNIANKKGMHPLHYAAMRGHNGVIIVLHSFSHSFSKHIDMNVANDFGSPLLFACAYGQHDTVEMLLQEKYKVDPNLLFNGASTSLLASIRSRSLECVKHLLEKHVDQNVGPVKPLALAAEVGEVEIINLLVQAGADANATNIYGITAIETAALHGNRRGVDVLFRETSPIAPYSNWSVDGVMKHVNSGEFALKMTLKEKEVFHEAKSRGTIAFRKKDYWLAVYWYTEALEIEPSNADVLCKRSSCYVNLKDGQSALEDATKSLLARQDCAEALYNKGVALRLLNRLAEATDALQACMDLDPGNREYESADMEVLVARFHAVLP